MRPIAAAFALSLACGCGSPMMPSCPNDLPASCPMPTPSWSTDVQPIVNARCANPCHSPTGQDPTRVFTDWQHVYNDRITVLSEVYSCKMPNPPAQPLDENERQILLGWLVCGAPNN